MSTINSAALARALERRLSTELVRLPEEATRTELFKALSGAIREQLAERWLKTERAYREQDARHVCYLSMEFHLGRLLRSAAQSLNLEDACRAALNTHGATLEVIEEEEAEPGLGSGGLGRLAACFMDSLATLDLPARGYGLRYDLGLFKQTITDGLQTEEADDWLANGFPWEVVRPQEAVVIEFGGRVDFEQDASGKILHSWVETEQVLAVPHDVLIPGYGTGTVLTLRLWAARAVGIGLGFDVFQSGAYVTARAPRNTAEAITTFLYPADQAREGKLLRLRQQFLLSSASLQDLLRRHLEANADLTNLPERAAVQLNDTHPALAIPELLRLLLDVHGFEWEEAWDMVQRLFAYTNHTLLPEALETWSVDLLSELLPRHLQIIREIDRRFQEDLRRRYPGDDERLRRMAIVSHGENPEVRMAHLCVLGSHTVNGVAALHTHLLKEGLLRDFCELTPEKFTNKTNGITPRRWLKQANPGLAALIDQRIGPGWERDLERLRELEVLAGDKAFQEEYREVKLANKRRLAEFIHRETGISVDIESIFDMQIKRFHEYKRQLLLLLWVIHRTLALRRNPQLDVPPRTVIFAGKAAPTYDRAKEVIALIHTLADSINNDPRVSRKLKVIFLPNYSVGMAEILVPAADVSEQISTAGYEASGTGNMKLALNGAITLGTLDGANVEIREEVGADNVIIFGLEAHQVRARREMGYRPRDHVEVDPELRAVIDALNGSAFTPRTPGRFGGLVEDLLERDTYMLLADFASYCEAQRRVDALFLERAAWTRKAILNTARMGKFSSDRTIRDYADGIWRLKPVRVDP